MILVLSFFFSEKAPINPVKISFNLTLEIRIDGLPVNNDELSDRDSEKFQTISDQTVSQVRYKTNIFFFISRFY